MTAFLCWSGAYSFESFQLLVTLSFSYKLHLKLSVKYTYR
jgi:hypothetical protein